MTWVNIIFLYITLNVQFSGTYLMRIFLISVSIDLTYRIIYNLLLSQYFMNMQTNSLLMNCPCDLWIKIKLVNLALKCTKSRIMYY